MAGPFSPVKNPSVNPWREKAAVSWSISSAVGSRPSRRARAKMEVTTATYSGRFIRPSSFRQATPIFFSSRRCPARDMSLRERG